jgi:N-acetylglucosamine repressor
MPKLVKKPQAVADLESAVIHVVQARGNVSRVDVARRLKLVPSTAGIYVDRLIGEGFLTESSEPASAGSSARPASAGLSRGPGRPPVLLRLNPRAGRFIGVDFDARQILAKCVDFAQQPVAEARRMIPARASVERVLEIIVEAIDELAGPRRNELLGIGLGVPGPVDPERGVSLRYSFLPNWRDVAVGPYVQRRFGVPTFVENNLRSMALAELWTGAGRGLTNLVCLGVRSGIGSGIIVNGRLLGGAHNAAGEIGRWIYPGAKSPTTADRPTTIEDLASVTALLSAADLPSVDELAAALERRERRVVALVKQAAEVHGWVVHQLDSLFDPEAIVVSGPLVEHEPYWSALSEAAQACGGDVGRRLSASTQSTPALRSSTQSSSIQSSSTQSSSILRPSTLGPFAGAIGAAALAFQHWKPRR